MRASSVDQPGIEPRFSEPKSDVIAFIPLVNNFVISEIGDKGTAFFLIDQIFFQKNVFLVQKVYKILNPHLAIRTIITKFLILVHKTYIIHPEYIPSLAHERFILSRGQHNYHMSRF